MDTDMSEIFMLKSDHSKVLHKQRKAFDLKAHNTAMHMQTEQKHLKVLEEHLKEFREHNNKFLQRT